MVTKTVSRELVRNRANSQLCVTPELKLLNLSAAKPINVKKRQNGRLYVALIVIILSHRQR
ncbi:hypothetical protein DN36_3311 [Vibrio cholerae]|nr:hypothetical protein DN36_3311 [Vibrio cholerae]